MNFFAYHQNAKAVPFANRFVSQLEWATGILLVVVKTAGALTFGVGSFVRWIPNLNLRSAAQINSAVALFRNLPIDIHFKIAVILGRRETAALAVENDFAILDLPMSAHVFV